MNDRISIKFDELQHIYDTMQRWLAGEPVWPYAKIIETWGEEFEMYRRRWSREHREHMAEAETKGTITFKQPDIETMVARGAAICALRMQWIGAFGFAIPCAELFDELAKSSHVIDVGAGSGYMTRLMRNRGINVIGSDPDLGGHGFTTGCHDPQQQKRDAKTMVRRYPSSTVFCSWPTLRETWFRQMLKAMEIGQKLVVIREDACAEDTAWQYLDDCFRDEAYINIPTFDHMNDYAQVAIKKRQR